MRKPCITCGVLIKRGSYCRTHDPRAKRNPARGRSGWQIQRWSNAVKARSGGRCVRCGTTENLEAHHLHPLAEGGAADGPGVALCRRCHAKARTI